MNPLVKGLDCLILDSSLCVMLKMLKMWKSCRHFVSEPKMLKYICMHQVWLG